jgi:hypothetical protein
MSLADDLHRLNLVRLCPGVADIAKSRQLESDLAEAVALLRDEETLRNNPAYKRTPVLGIMALDELSDRRSRLLARIDARKGTPQACKLCDWAIATKPCDGCPDPAEFARARKGTP